MFLSSCQGFYFVIIIQKLSHSGCHYEHLRQTMVERQLRPNGITDERLLNAFLTIKRENFVFPQQRDSCYSDHLTPLKGGRCMLPALSLARLIQGLVLKPSSNVLVFGCGLGYSLEILRALGMNATGIEVPLLAQIGNKNMPSNHPILEGCLQSIPSSRTLYDAVLIEGGIDEIPLKLATQLKDQGRLGCLMFDDAKTHSCGYTLKKNKDTLVIFNYFEASGYMLNEFSSGSSFVF
ncbi:MAG: Protein-L-isoaspartate O-methyltransferase [Holosporales bacterium]